MSISLDKQFTLTIVQPALPTHSQKLKEDQFDKKCKHAVKPSVKDEPDVPLTMPATKPPPHAKTPKDPTLREVLKQIKASAARDSELDELDCLRWDY